MDEAKRTVSLKGEPQQVVTQYKTVKASKIEIAAMTMPRQDTADEKGSAPHSRMPGVKGGVLYNGSDKMLDYNKAPGSGVGPRVAPKKGGSKSDMQHKIDSADEVIEEMHTDKKKRKKLKAKRARK